METAATLTGRRRTDHDGSPRCVLACSSPPTSSDGGEQRPVASLMSRAQPSPPWAATAPSPSAHVRPHPSEAQPRSRSGASAPSSREHVLPNAPDLVGTETQTDPNFTPATTHFAVTKVRHFSEPVPASARWAAPRRVIWMNHDVGQRLPGALRAPAPPPQGAPEHSLVTSAPISSSSAATHPCSLGAQRVPTYCPTSGTRHWGPRRGR